MKLFSELRSCYRPQTAPPSTVAAAPPSDDDSHRVSLHASDHRSRVLHRSHWRPSLSVIVEDSMDQDQYHRDNVAKKSQKKSFAKPRSSSSSSSSSLNYINSCSFLTENRSRSGLPPAIIIAPFSATPYLF